jgi:tRNA threonylcarbamoyladenosine biosynthesis protein TsaE
MLEESEGWYSGKDKGMLVARVLAAAPVRAYAVTRSAEETEEVAARLAARVVEGDVVTVSGELGSGKTTFVRGACRALGVEAPVTSPTFTIGHRYEGRVDVSHLDLFRFDGLSPAEWGDLEPYFDDAVVFVEWPEAGAGALPEPRAGVRLDHAGGHRRAVTLTAAEGALLEGFA